MKKALRVVSLFLILSLLLSLTVFVNAEEQSNFESYMEQRGITEYYRETVDGVNYTYTVDESANASIIHVRTNVTESQSGAIITFPEKLGGYQVTTIGCIENRMEIFLYKNDGEDLSILYPRVEDPEYDPGLRYISKFIIPEGYEYIADMAFYTAGLQFQVKFPKSLKKIYGAPFESIGLDESGMFVLPECEYSDFSYFFDVATMGTNDNAVVSPSRYKDAIFGLTIWKDGYLGYSGNLYIPSNITASEFEKEQTFFYFEAAMGDFGGMWPTFVDATIHCAPDCEWLSLFDKYTYESGFTYWDQVVLDVVPATHIAFDNEAVSVKVGEVVDLEAKTYPAEAVWTACDYVSSNPEVVKVDPYSGRITALAEGEATITATHVERGFVDTCTVTVEPKEAEYKVGDIVEFGSYPQTQVTDDALISELNSLELDWQWYDYYKREYVNSAKNYESQSAEIMQYADVAYNGDKYRAVNIKEYRSEELYQKDNGFVIDNVYWYKYEPITWMVLEPQYGLLIAEKVLDSQPMSEKYYYNSTKSWQHYVDSSCSSYPNEYEISTLRNWLNNDFYYAAFTTEQKNNISVRDLDSDGKIYDKVFLLSLDEVTSADYGFMNASTEDKTRVGYGTEYALSQGLKKAENCSWFTRSVMPLAYPDLQNEFIYSGRQGVQNEDLDALSTFGGIRPAIQIDLNAIETEPEHECTYSTEWSFDETGHWYACTDSECEETTNYAEHSGGTATVNAKAVCEYCGVAYGEYAKASFAVEPVSDIAYCTYSSREYKVTVSGSPDKIQFIRSTGTTSTYVRSQAKITDNGDGTETWVVTARLNKGAYTLAAKYGRVWNKNGVEFEIAFDTPSCRSFTSEKTGNITTFTVVTDPQVAKIQLITQSGNTLTYSRANSYLGEDGLRYWTVSRKITKPGTIGLRTKYGYTWTTTDFTIEV